MEIKVNQEGATGLLVEKMGFNICYDGLTQLINRLRERASSFNIDRGEDTSMTGNKEQACCEELLKMMEDLAALAEETKADIKLTQARYVLADE